jgi:hypothetical protein
MRRRLVILENSKKMQDTMKMSKNKTRYLRKMLRKLLIHIAKEQLLKIWKSKSSILGIKYSLLT